MRRCVDEELVVVLGRLSANVAAGGQHVAALAHVVDCRGLAKAGHVGVLAECSREDPRHGFFVKTTLDQLAFALKPLLKPSDPGVVVNADTDTPQGSVVSG